MIKNLLIPIALSALIAFPVHAQEIKSTDGVNQRTHGQNYKDSVLASCIGKIYKTAGDADKTARITEWAAVYKRLDLENQTDTSEEQKKAVSQLQEASRESGKLIDEFTARNYTGQRPRPRTMAASTWVPLDLLKCFDLYHSKALDDIVKKYVHDPDKIAGE